MKKNKIEDEILNEIKEKLPDLYKLINDNNLLAENFNLYAQTFFQALVANDKLKDKFKLEFKFDKEKKKITWLLVDKNDSESNDKISSTKEFYSGINFPYDKMLIDFNKDVDKVAGRKEIISFIHSISKTYPNCKGFWLYGDFGVGKTYISYAFLNWLANTKKATVSIIFLSEVVTKIKASFSQQNNDLLYETFKELKIVDALIIDDIGSENTTEWYRDEFLFPILSYRLENKKLTCFTSNISINEYEKNLLTKWKNSIDDWQKTKRFINKINSLVVEIPIKGKNRRL